MVGIRVVAVLGVSLLLFVRCSAPPMTEDAGTAGGSAGGSAGGTAGGTAGGAAGGAAGGSEDAGSVDAGGEADAGAVLDAGTPDSGSTFDAGPPDAGSPDAGPLDAGPPVCTNLVWPAPPCDAGTLDGKLRCIPGLTITATDGGRWDLLFTQPVDHDFPDAGTFQQRVSLLHVTSANPMVLATTGYDLFTFRSEPTRMFAANQLMYEHRYFTPSRPVPTDWSKLTIRQSARDAHRLAEAFHWLYPGPWLNTGVSKGGMTSVYHRRFFPCDVDATVAYVAPSSSGAVDPEYPLWLDSVGGSTWAACRQSWKDFQLRALQQRATLQPMMAGTYTRLGPDKVFEMVVVEANFQFWQYQPPADVNLGCPAIPSASATPSQMWNFLSYHGTPQNLASDSALAAFEPYYFQAVKELGAPAPFDAHLQSLEMFPGIDIAATYLPPTNVPAHDATAMPDVTAWLHGQSERMMFIYGEYDVWSARKYTLGGARDAFVFVQPGGNHNARIGLLNSTDKASAVQVLERWMGRSVTVMPTLRAETFEPDEDPETLPRWPL